MNAALPLAPLVEADTAPVPPADGNVGNALMRDAVRLAPAGSRLQWMVQQSGLEAGRVLSDVAAALGLRPMATEALQGIAPDFELISFADCQARGCLGGWSTGPSGDRLRTVVVSDPWTSRARNG